MRMRTTSGYGAVVATTALLLCRCGWAQERMARLLNVAREELRSAALSEQEIQVRLKIVENVATVKAYYPHARGGRPEMRNPKCWEPNRDGSYVPRGRPTQAIRDLWKTESGIRCRKLAMLVMIKALIDVADEERLAALDEMLRGKVIPNELPKEGIGTLFEKPEPKEGRIFQTDELLPGDEVWCENPYFKRLSGTLQRRYIGQEGHHVFYIGAGKVMDMYSRKPLPIEDFRRTFLRWNSVRIVAGREKHKPKAAEFQIKAVRRVIVGKEVKGHEKTGRKGSRAEKGHGQKRVRSRYVKHRISAPDPFSVALTLFPSPFSVARSLSGKSISVKYRISSLC